MQYTLRRRFAKVWALSIVMIMMSTVLVTLIVTSSAIAADGIMLQIRDRPLREVVMLLTQQSGMNIVIADESKLDQRVTVSLNNVQLEKALDYVVKSAGISYKKMEDGTYIIGGAAVSDASVLSPKDVASVLPPVDMITPESPKPAIFTKIQLVHSKPSEVLRLLGWDGSNPMPNCEAEYPERLGKKLSNVSNPGNGGVYLKPRQGDSYDLKQGVTIENNQPVVPTVDPRGTSSGSGRTADERTGAAQVVDTPGGRPPGYTGYRQPTPTPAPATSSSSNSGNFLWPEGVENAVPFDLDNSIIVKGDQQGIEDFKNVIRMLDVPPKQVEIKAEFVEVKTTDIKRFGIDWSLERLNQSFNTAFGPVGNVIYSFASGNLTAQLKAQLTSDVGRIINAPIISTINNQNAYISINNSIPYWVTIATVVGENVVNQATPQFITIDTHLDVLPRVNGDGTITMILKPGVADTGNIVTGPDGSEIPEQRNQELFTQRRVNDGETIVIGGFIRKNDSNSYQKIPILGDLPIVGSLFRTSAKTTEDRELLIFITPKVIKDTGSGMLGSAPTP